MAEPTGTLSGFERWFAWLNAVVLLFAAAWGSVPGLGENPLPGLRRVSASLWIAWPLALAGLSAAAYTSVRRWHSVATLSFMAGGLACGWLVLSLYVSPGPAIGFGLLAGMLYRSRGSLRNHPSGERIAGRSRSPTRHP